MIRIFIFSLYILFASIGMRLMGNQDTNQHDQAVFTFGLIADVQYCESKSQGSRYYRNSLTKLNKAINEFNSLDIDFIINLGDLIDRDYQSYAPVMEILEKSNKEIYHVIGNHDLTVKNRYKKEVKDLLTGEETYFSFTRKGFRFIVLNTCEISTYYGSLLSANKAKMILDNLKSKGYPNAHDWNGQMSRRQIRWFKKQLAESEARGEHVLVFSHHTIEPMGPHNVLNREEMLEITSDYDNIIAWFCGHDHSGSYSKLNGIHFVTMRGMVETPDSTAWSVIEIHPNKLWIKGRGNEKTQVLEY